jgi:large conductance mechanosensitive channel
MTLRMLAGKSGPCPRMGDTLGDMINGFKEFILKGNVIDLAVAVIIGASFGAVVNALVNSVLMPFIAGLVGSPNFDSFLLWNFNGNKVAFGVLLTAIVNFLLIASAIYFVVVVPMNHLIDRRNRRLGINKTEEAVDPQIALLTEIRDSLQARNRM